MFLSYSSRCSILTNIDVENAKLQFCVYIKIIQKEEEVDRWVDERKQIMEHEGRSTYGGQEMTHGQRKVYSVQCN